jgi:hypothetical protein
MHQCQQGGRSSADTTQHPYEVNQQSVPKLCLPQGFVRLMHLLATGQCNNSSHAA